MKKWPACLLLLALLLSLFGCNAEPVTSTTTGQNTFATSASSTQTGTSNNDDPFAEMEQVFSLLPENGNGSALSTTAEIRSQTLPLTLDNPDDLPVLKWVCLVSSGTGAYKDRRWSSAAVEELNQMLSDRNASFRVQFQIVASESSANDWFARQGIEQLIEGADLIYGYATQQDLPNWFAPISQYVTGDAKLSLTNAVAHEINWRSTTFGGEIYGIPTEPEQALGNGWWIDTAFMEKCGLTAEDFSRNFWEMDEIFEIMYKQNNNKPFLYYDGDGYETQPTKHGILTGLPLGGIADAIDYTNYQTIGASFGIDLSADKPVVVDMLATDITRNIQQAFLRYRTAGYVTNKQELNKIQYFWTRGSEPYYYDSKTLVPVSETMILGSEWNYVTGISKDSQYPEEAAALLQLIAEDEEFRMQLLYGKEGRDYKVEDGLYTLIPQADGSTYSLDFLSPLAWFNGFVGEGTTLYLSPSTRPQYFAHEGKTLLESYRDNMDALRYCHYPVIFDYSGYEEELENIAKVMSRYYPSFQGLSEDNYDKMLELMELAGSKKILAELQRQLDAWVAANPDWDPLG